MTFSKSMKLKLDQIVDYLKGEGCSKIYLFGSVAEDVSRPDSDIDIAVCDIPPKTFFKAIACLPHLIKHPVDIVDFAELPPKFRESIERNGMVLYAD